MFARVLVGALGAGVALIPVHAFAQEDPELDEEVEDVGEAAVDLGEETVDVAQEVVEEARTNVVTVTAGLGVEGYMSPGMQDTVGGAMLWDVRAIVSIWEQLSLEGAYVGTGAGIDARFVDESATLIGTTFEAAAHWNFMEDSALQPFAFAGLGWRNLQVVGEDFSTSDEGVADSDNLLILPVGAGLGYRSGDFYVDGRATLRFATGADLVRTSTFDDDRSQMHAFAVTGRVGYDF